METTIMDYIRFIVFRGYIGRVEKKMKTTI